MGSDQEPEEQESEGGTDPGCEALSDAASEAAPEDQGEAEDAPAWADGLKELYRSVVDEPLPGSFKDLLDQFDETGEDGDATDPGNPA